MRVSQQATSSSMLEHLPVGARIPASAHAVSVSIPDIASVVGFESRAAETLARIRHGYPRFRPHPYIARLAGMINPSTATECILVRSARAAAAAHSYARVAHEVVSVFGLHGLIVPRGSPMARQARAFVQHTGSHLSSREAEDALVDLGLHNARFPETAMPPDAAAASLSKALADAYTSEPRLVSLHNSGMNAIYAALRAIGQLQERRGRHRWLQLGWMFFDTVELLRKQIVPGTPHALANVFDVDALTGFIEAHGHELAGIVIEVPTNPLLQTPDVALLRMLADRAGCVLVIDATIATPHNVDVLPYADVVCESLTKYATGAADVLLGAAIVNPQARFRDELINGIARHGEHPYWRDVARAAARVTAYAERMAHVNANTMGVAAYLEERRGVRHVNWAYERRSCANYAQLARRPASPGGLLLIDLDIPLERVYDPLRVAKGPSFGAEFTMASAQVFIAHFDLLSSSEGRRILREHGLHRNMLRLSVGTEPLSDILAALEEVFTAAPSSSSRNSA